MSELNRFSTLFEQVFEHTLDFVGKLPMEAFVAVPADSEWLFHGGRVNKITIGGLLRHFIVAETHWFKALPEVQDGDTIPLPQNAAMLEGVTDGEPLLAAYRAAYTQYREQISRFNEADLDKTFSFSNREYTVMGFLWAMYLHHGFHMGQVDLLVRQQNIAAPELMDWPKQGLIA